MTLIKLYKQYEFVFKELVKRDFKKKYKRSVLGVIWSMLAPLCTLVVLNFVFGTVFGRTQEYYTIYLFSGWLIFQFYNDATNGAMSSLIGNANIFSKVRVPKYMFLFSKNVSSLINFGITLGIYFVFVAINGIPFTWKFVLLLFPILCLVVFNLGMGLILSALYVFFRDIQYLYSIFTLLLMYMSAIFYSIETFPQIGKNLFFLNPIYVYIRYFRKIVIEGDIPSIWLHLAALGYAVAAFGIGAWIYKKKNHSFLYYV